MVNRWDDRPEPGLGEGTVYWHMLMRDHPEVAELARQAKQRLAPFATGLHMTPQEWLHMTTFVAGPAVKFSPEQLQQMTRTAKELLASRPPIPITLGRILYHPEAIMLGVASSVPLIPMREAAAKATYTVTGCPEAATDTSQWTPHVTICYSIADQPAQPIIDTLGLQLPERKIEIDALQLVIQHGPERLWDWSIVSTINLGKPERKIMLG
jgi:2'-5' RNA ligase